MNLYEWTPTMQRRLRVYSRKLQRLTSNLRASGCPLTQDDVDRIARVIMAYAQDPDTPLVLEAYRKALWCYARPGHPGPYRIITCLHCVDAHLYLPKGV
jgi:hypothetical protein